MAGLSPFAPYYFFDAKARKGNGGWSAVYRESEFVVLHVADLTSAEAAMAVVPEGHPRPTLKGSGAPDGWTPGEVNPRQPRPDIESPAQRFAAQMAKAARNAVKEIR